MSERDPQRWARFTSSVLALLVVVVAAPLGLGAVARSRFGSANPLSGADPPWRWGSDGVGDALSGPIADDTVIDGIVRLSLCVVWVALAVIAVTTVIEVIHAVRHHGLGLPERTRNGVGTAGGPLHRDRIGGRTPDDDIAAVVGVDTRRTICRHRTDRPPECSKAHHDVGNAGRHPGVVTGVVTGSVTDRLAGGKRGWCPRGGVGRVDLLDRGRVRGR